MNSGPHLDAPCGIEWLQSAGALSGSLVGPHDRYFLDGSPCRIVEVDRGDAQLRGNYGEPPTANKGR